MCALHIHTIRLERVHDFHMPSSNGKAANNIEHSSVEETPLLHIYLMWEEQTE